jgi:RNA polymerase sigma factor (TIGR02999 family)
MKRNRLEHAAEQSRVIGVAPLIEFDARCGPADDRRGVRRTGAIASAVDRLERWRWLSGAEPGSGVLNRGKMHDPGTITSILREAREGRSDAIDRLFPLLYDELHRLALHQLRGQSDRTLNATALVNEAYLRMVDQTQAEFADRAHFFAYAARAMRGILVDYARRRGALKRGGGLAHVSLDERDIPVAEQAELLVALDDALTGLASLSERLSRIVEYRFFGGMTEQETATALGVSDRTVRRDWIKAKAWLYAELSGQAPV